MFPQAAKNPFAVPKSKTNALTQALIARKTGKTPGVMENYVKHSNFGHPKFQKSLATIASKE